MQGRLKLYFSRFVSLSLAGYPQGTAHPFPYHAGGGSGPGVLFGPATYGPGQLARALGYWPLKGTWATCDLLGERWRPCVARLAQNQGVDR